MRVHVLLFGPLAEVYGLREEWLDLQGAPTAATIYEHYLLQDARIGELGRSLHVAVNQVVVSGDRLLAAGDEVALLPPVCGGSGADRDLIDLVETPLEIHTWREEFVKSAKNFGAVTCFEGLVRPDMVENKIGAGPVVALVFDAYRPMALSVLARLADDARKRWQIEKLVMLHRLGKVPVGEVCVVVAVATGHREEAFAACRFLIDTLKATAPIWKKEISASTSRWVEGVMLPGANE